MAEAPSPDGVPANPGIAALYVHAQQSFAAMFQRIPPDRYATPVPSCPGWTVRDVLSHVAGIPDDAFNQRMDGAVSDAWTARQVDRWRDADVAELLAQWDAQAAPFGQVIESIGEHRPPFDCHEHEHDVRAALKLPGNRDSLIVQLAAHQLATSIGGPRPVEVHLADGRVWHGGGSEGTPLQLRGVTPYELFRSRLGRRTPGQVLAYDWSDDPGPVMDTWFSFGPAAEDVLDD